ncbi:MAG TPA: DUF1934 domain-containing protein [Methylomusa anaerophila]|uniref:Putative beta-barrel protein YwiB n=1 Tax=Methylomusa anaerophila TaxID=1930071 RepID=A0A348AJG0_9FIRM|nr:DUF1934 domain-containing protein [Methylomusa anaerophila]BBB91208.1 putative beta-barrel protein YwiB [Methylomusa anaerophila]HML89797.1 DUF1934 domain-containing protein [Methylomusa anaerophila]
MCKKGDNVNLGDTDSGRSKAVAVALTIVGTQRDVLGEENRIELFTLGHYYYTKGIHYITYQETEISGMEGATTLLQVDPDQVILVRSGSIEQRQVFSPGQWTYSDYLTAQGIFKMNVLTTGLDIGVTGDGAGLPQIRIDYELEIGGQWQSKNTLSVTIQGDKSNGH